jgi:hypothetical protein
LFRLASQAHKEVGLDQFKTLLFPFEHPGFELRVHHNFDYLKNFNHEIILGQLIMVALTLDVEKDIYDLVLIQNSKD